MVRILGIIMKVCIVGTGMIAHEVAKALRSEATEIEITAVCSHSNREKAEEMAREYNISKAYTDYNDLLHNDDADFVYLGVVNTAHFSYAHQALMAGRNVIVEKPFTTTVEEAQTLAAIARERHLWLFEAITTLHLPNFQLAQELLPRIGQVRIIQANYSQYSSRYNRYLCGDVAPAFNPKLGGGALNDLGIYNINAIVGLFGKPVKSQYYANRGFNGVDTSGILVIQYPTAMAVCICAKDSTSPSGITIQGEKGTLTIPSAPNTVAKVTLTINGTTEEWQKNKYASRLVHEFKDFEHIWLSHDVDAMNHYLDTYVEVMEVLTNHSNFSINNIHA